MDGDAGDADYDEVHTNAAYLRADESSDYGENRSDSGEEYESRQEVSPASAGGCVALLFCSHSTLCVHRFSCASSLPSLARAEPLMQKGPRTHQSCLGDGIVGSAHPTHISLGC